MTNNIMDETITLDDKNLITYFGNEEVQVSDLIDALSSLLEEKEDLERKLEEEYEPKKINPYEEYGISENDFH